MKLSYEIHMSLDDDEVKMFETLIDNKDTVQCVLRYHPSLHQGTG